jgi:hypothetical protein
MVFFRQTGKTHDARSIIKEMVDRIAKLEAQQNPIETPDFTQIVRSNNDTIAYVCSGSTEINAVVLDPALKLYQMPIEPDGDKLTCWLKFHSTTDGKYTDASGFGNHAPVDSGAPITQSGPVSGLPSLQFNGTDDAISVPNHTSINTVGTSTGISINFNINPTQVNAHGGQSRIIACKTDDSVTARNNGWMIWIEPDSTLYFHVRVANVFYTGSKTFAFPSLNKWYRVFCTFDKTASPSFLPKIYVNGVVSTEPTTTYTGGLTLPSASTNLYVGSNDIVGQSHLSGFVSDFRYWREKVVNQTEIDNIQQNNYSISATMFVARAGVGNFAANEVTGDPGTPPDTPPPPPPTTHTIKSFTNASFSEASFMPV